MRFPSIGQKQIQLILTSNLSTHWLQKKSKYYRIFFIKPIFKVEKRLKTSFFFPFLIKKSTETTQTTEIESKHMNRLEYAGLW